MAQHSQLGNKRTSAEPSLPRVAAREAGREGVGIKRMPDVPRLDVLAASVVATRGDLRGLTASALSSLPEGCVLLLLASLARRLALTRPLVLAFADCGHAGVVAAVRALITDADSGVVGGLATTCRD